MLKHLATRPLETRFGWCEERYYYDGVRSYIALVVGEVAGHEQVLCRVHSSCMSAHYFSSIECDCREQMETAQERIHREGRGIIVWLEQEARDNGHLALMLSAELKASGVHQTEAYEQLGLPGDARSYRGAAMVLKELRVASVVLLTNNPSKVAALRDAGINVHDTVKLVPNIQRNSHLDLLYKDKEQQGHSLDPLTETLCDVAVLGDVNVDVVLRENLSIEFGDLKNDVVMWQPIDDRPGGTGLNFATIAKQRGYAVFLVGKVGSDPAGAFLKQWLQTERIANGVTIAEAAPTGKAIIIRDERDIRMLIDNAPNANQELNELEVRQHACAIAHAKFAYLSGYAVQHPGAKCHAAACEFMRIAATGGATLVFDVVPHRIYETYSSDEFFKLTREVKILISEVSTMRRFLKLGSSDEMVDRAVVQETIVALAATKAYQAFVLRYGPSGCDEQLIWDGRNVHYQTLAHAEARGPDGKRGFGDRVTIDTLEKYFGLQGHTGQSGDGSL